MNKLIKYLGLAALVAALGCKPAEPPQPPQNTPKQTYFYSGRLLGFNNAEGTYSFLLDSDSKKSLISCRIDNNLHPEIAAESISKLATLKDLLSTQQKSLSNQVENVKIVGNYENGWFVCKNLKGNDYKIYFRLE